MTPFSKSEKSYNTFFSELQVFLMLEDLIDPCGFSDTLS